jgi:hypothetical protein
MTTRASSLDRTPLVKANDAEKQPRETGSAASPTPQTKIDPQRKPKKLRKKTKKKSVIPDHLHHKHNHGLLGRRVKVTHPPANDKVSKTLVYKSGVVVKCPSTKLEVILDDGRKLAISREFLALNKNFEMHAVDIHLTASNLKILDLSVSSPPSTLHIVALLSTFR